MTHDQYITWRQSKNDSPKKNDKPGEDESKCSLMAKVIDAAFTSWNIMHEME